MYIRAVGNNRIEILGINYVLENNIIMTTSCNFLYSVIKFYTRT